MKLSLTIAVLFISQFAAAQSVQICGTPNQWPAENQSGWFFKMDRANKSAMVVKYENSETRRAYGYAVSENGSELVLTSTFGDTLVLTATKANEYTGRYANKGLNSESFVVTCYSKSKIANIPEYDSPFSNLKIAQYIANESALPDLDKKALFFVQKTEIPFAIMANLFLSPLSRMGDWEETVPNEKQAALIDSGKGLSADDQKRFAALKALIQDDIQTLPGLKQVGYVFGRDWYHGDGTIGIVLSYQKFLVVVPFDFEGSAQFNDPRLDHVY